jgi:hypothetical protein
MKHTELNQLWKTQEERLLEWRHALREQALRFRSELAVAIEAPPDWVDPTTGERTRYVDLLYLPPDGERIKGQIPDHAITENGELIFGVCMTFEESQTSRAREVVYVPVALRFFGGQPQFAFWSTESKEIDGGWQPALTTFIGALLERIGNYVSSDPFQGFVGRSSIGFL